MPKENIKHKRIGQIAVICRDRYQTSDFYCGVFGWEDVFGTQSFMGKGVSEVQGMENAAVSSRWLIDSRKGFQVEIFEYSCPESKPLPSDACISDEGNNRIIIATRSLAEILDRLQQQFPEYAHSIQQDDNGQRALLRDPDGVLLEVVQRPELVPAQDQSVMVGVGITVDDLTLLREDLELGFGFKPTVDLFEHALHWDLEGQLEQCLTLQLEDMYIVASRYRDSRQRPADYKLGDIGIMNFAVIHPSMEAFKTAYLQTCSLGMRSNSVPNIIPGKGAVVYQNTRGGVNIEMQYLDTSIWGLFGYSKASWLDHVLDALATWKARREYRKYVNRQAA